MARKNAPAQKSTKTAKHKQHGGHRMQMASAPPRATGPIIRSMPERDIKKSPYKIFLKWTISAVAILLVITFLYLLYKVRKSVSAETGVVKVSGLHSTATISRDELGVPLIKADNEDDAFFAAGYAAANDRLWQMYSTKLAVTGRLAEIAGSKMLPVDVYMRTVGIKRNVDRAIDKLPFINRAPLEAYSKGVNAYLKSHPHLPLEFVLTGYAPEPWTAYDCGYVFGALSFGLALNINEELFFLDAAAKLGSEKAAWLVPTYQDEPIPFAEAQKIDKKIALDLAPHTDNLHAVLTDLDKIFRTGMPASNNWVISGAKTKGGKAILANDTHLPVTLPAIWSMMSIDSPTYKAAGVTIAGQPYIQLGFNGNIAWGATMVEADCQDLFVETLKLENGQTLFLKTDSTWAPVRESNEHFIVRFGHDRDVKIRFTANGPLISDALAALDKEQLTPLVPVGWAHTRTKVGSIAATAKIEKHLAMRWSLQDGDQAGIGIYEMAAASTMGEFRAAASKINSIYLNLVYTDGENIAWQTTGRIPVRTKGTGQLPSIAADGYRWKSFLSFEQQPHKENPETGFLATANQRIVANNDVRKISSVYYSPERAERIAHLLSAKDDWSGIDTAQMQLDIYSLMAEKTRSIFRTKTVEIVAAIGKLSKKKQQRALSALEMLEKFDNVMAKDSKGAALIAAFYHVFTRNVFGDELEIDSTLWKEFIETNLRSYSAPQDHILGRDESPYFDNIATAEKETKADMIALALADAYEFCGDKMGSVDKWRWGKLHKIFWRHDISKDIGIASAYFNYGRVTHEGDSHTINVGHYPWGENFDTFAIPAMRLIVDFNTTEPAQLIIHTGVSGNPSSEHYTDQIKYFVDGRNHLLPLGDAAKHKQYANVLTLQKP